MIRIAIIGPTFPYKGGGAHHTTELAHRLAAAGHDVMLESWKAQYPALLYPGRQTVSEPDGEPFPETRRALSWRRPDSWLRAGRRLNGCDLVALATLSPVQVPPYLGILRGLGGACGRRCRVVAICHNVLPHEPKPYDAPLMRALLGRVDEVLVHSAEQGALARDLVPSTPVRVAELPAHLPAKALTAADRASLPSPARPGVDAAGHRMIRLLFFGMVRPYKGLDVLLRALAAGPRTVSLIVAGEFWGGVEETERLVGELGLADRVELRPGYVPAVEVPGLFAGADALVLPYRSATASQNVLLAYEHGVPVVATRTGALADHVRDGVDGVLCEPDDVDALTGALARFCAPGEADRLRAGVRPVDPEPQWATYLDRLLAG